MNRNNIYRLHIPSPLFIWYQTESAKREDGLLNDLDLADITQASKGVRNKWFKRVQVNPDVFKSFLDGAKPNWEAFKACTEEKPVGIKVESESAEDDKDWPF